MTATEGDCYDPELWHKVAAILMRRTPPPHDTTIDLDEILALDAERIAIVVSYEDDTTMRVRLLPQDEADDVARDHYRRN